MFCESAELKEDAVLPAADILAEKSLVLIHHPLHCPCLEESICHSSEKGIFNSAQKFLHFPKILCKIHGFHTASCRHACQSQNNWVSHFYK
jgi:hypothetical protein